MIPADGRIAFDNWGSEIDISSRCTYVWVYESHKLHPRKAPTQPHPHDQTRLLLASYEYVPSKKRDHIIRYRFFRDEKIGPNREIGDISGYPIFRYGDYIHLEVVLRASKTFCSRVATSMGAVYSNYNHTLYIHINSLRTIGQWSWIIVKSNTVSTFGVPPWLCLLEYCVLKLSCQSWQSITHSRNYIIVTYRLRNCNSWEFRLI